MSYFGESVRAAREYRGWTQLQLADKSGLTVTAIAMIERGERNPQLSTALQIAYALDVTLDFLTSDYYARRRQHETAIAQENPGHATE